MAGPTGVRQIGSVHELPDAEAAQLIDGGYADLVFEPGAFAAPGAEPVVEAAAEEPVTEMAAIREPPRRRRGR